LYAEAFSEFYFGGGVEYENVLKNKPRGGGLS